jgi:glycerophosphoryl diester phosphodiesterase
VLAGVGRARLAGVGRARLAGVGRESMPSGRRPAISAHRGGGETGPDGTYQAYADAVAAGADYVEFDVRASADGILVASHRAGLRPGLPVARLAYADLCRQARDEIPRLDVALGLLSGRAGAHLDIKDRGCAVAAVQHAAAALGPERVLATTRDRALAAALARRFPAVGIGLTRGGDLPESARFAVRRLRAPGWNRLGDITTAGAGWAVLHYRLARTGLLTQVRQAGLRAAIWTVNADGALRQWLASPDANVVVTDRPARAIAVRAGI